MTSIREFTAKNMAESLTAFGSPLFYIMVIVLLARTGFGQWPAVAVALASTEAVCACIKIFFPTIRPVPRANQGLLGRYDAGSFPSIHTARTASLAFSLTRCIDDPALVIAGIFLVIGVGWSRTVLGHHYAIDVIAGCVIGLTVSFLVFALW